MCGLSAEEMQAWIAANQQETGVTTPVVVKKEKFRCDSCKQFMSPLETVVHQSGEYCHMTEKCLPKFAKKHHWEHIKFENVQLITSEGEI